MEKIVLILQSASIKVRYLTGIRRIMLLEKLVERDKLRYAPMTMMADSETFYA